MRCWTHLPFWWTNELWQLSPAVEAQVGRPIKTAKLMWHSPMQALLWIFVLSQSLSPWSTQQTCVWVKCCCHWNLISFGDCGSSGYCRIWKNVWRRFFLIKLTWKGFDFMWEEILLFTTHLQFLFFFPTNWKIFLSIFSLMGSE